LEKNEFNIPRSVFIFIRYSEIPQHLNTSVVQDCEDCHRIVQYKVKKLWT